MTAVQAFGLVLLLLAAGKLCAWRRVLPGNTAEALNGFVLWILLPAAILRHAAGLALDADLLRVALLPWLLLAASVAAVAAFARAARLGDAERAALYLCVPLGNTSFLGYPLVQALLGEDALRYAVVYDQFGSFLMLSTWGLWVLARYGGDARPTVAGIAARVLRFPPFLALLAALCLVPDAPPRWLDETLRRLSEALLPVVAFAVGFSLRLRLARTELGALGAGLVLKLLLLPLLALGLAAALSLRGAAHDAAVLESAMPPMITAAALAVSHRLAPALAAALVGYGTLFALATLPLWRALL